MKYEFDAIARVVKGGEQVIQFELSDKEIAKLETGTLWLWGKGDTFAGSEIANRIHGKVKDSHLVEFENAGHLPWLDHPEEHARLISDFIVTKDPVSRKSVCFRVKSDSVAGP